MSGIAPILDRIASIESRFARATPAPPQALGMSPERRGSADAVTTTSAPSVVRTSSADYATRFDQAMAAAEAALPGADFGRTGALPPGLELISADPSRVSASALPPRNAPSGAGADHAHDHDHGRDHGHVMPTSIPVSSWTTMPNIHASTSDLARGVTTPLWETSTGLATSAAMPTPTLPTSTLPAGTPFADEFQRAGTAHDVPANLLAAVGWVESRYDIGAVSPDGAIGLMQLMPGTAAHLGVDPHDPTAAIDGAARLLRGHHDRFGSWDLALAAYFSGPGAVAQNGNQAPPRGAAYAQRVMQRMENS